MDTIAAIATAPGEAGIAIVRISGSNAIPIADTLFRGSGVPPSERPAGTFLHGHVATPNGRSRQAVDEVILLVYRAPHSYTREDVVEIQGHGGRTCAARILRCAVDAGARPAEPGEFTKRAFLNGRIDLVQAEAVADLVRATSDRAASAALQQLDGSLSSVVAACYDSLLATAADMEATLDFSDEELPGKVFSELAGRLDGAAARLQELLATWEEGHMLREGALVVICGKPNVGKSTLLNRLLGSDRAIVAHTPGTTRDTIEESVILNGVLLRLVDTAGLRETECRIEQEGVRRAEDHIARADAIVHVVDASQELSPEDRRFMQHTRPQGVLIVLNKTDLGHAVTPESLGELPAVACSLVHDDTVEPVRSGLADVLGIHTGSPPHAVISQRHRTHIQSALNALNATLRLLAEDRDDMVVIAATTLRRALEQLGLVIGKTYTDEMMDAIFSRFCIGK